MKRAGRRCLRRVLPLLVGLPVADQFAGAVGRPIAAMDAFIAATAERHDLTLVTRNLSDFQPTGIRLINPWTSA